jgi:hypothetical protein
VYPDEQAVREALFEPGDPLPDQVLLPLNVKADIIPLGLCPVDVVGTEKGELPPGLDHNPLHGGFRGENWTGRC